MKFIEEVSILHRSLLRLFSNGSWFGSVGKMKRQKVPHTSQLQTTSGRGPVLDCRSLLTFVYVCCKLIDTTTLIYESNQQSF